MYAAASRSAAEAAAWIHEGSRCVNVLFVINIYVCAFLCMMILDVVYMPCTRIHSLTLEYTHSFFFLSVLCVIVNPQIKPEIKAVHVCIYIFPFSILPKKKKRHFWFCHLKILKLITSSIINMESLFYWWILLLLLFFMLDKYPKHSSMGCQKKSSIFIIVRRVSKFNF